MSNCSNSLGKKTIFHIVPQYILVVLYVFVFSIMCSPRPLRNTHLSTVDVRNASSCRHTMGSFVYFPCFSLSLSHVILHPLNPICHAVGFLRLPSHVSNHALRTHSLSVLVSECVSRCLLRWVPIGFPAKFSDNLLW